MLELTKDNKSATWIITKTDREGFHRQMNVSEEEMEELVRVWKERKKL